MCCEFNQPINHLPSNVFNNEYFHFYGTDISNLLECMFNYCMLWPAHDVISPSLEKINKFKFLYYSLNLEIIKNKQYYNLTKVEMTTELYKNKAFENEFGNLTGGGEYRCHCEDCGFRWSDQK